MRRNIVSVTPAIGASTVPGAISMWRIEKLRRIVASNFAEGRVVSVASNSPAWIYSRSRRTLACIELLKLER